MQNHRSSIYRHLIDLLGSSGWKSEKVGSLQQFVQLSIYDKMRVSVLEIAADLDKVTNLRLTKDYEYDIKFKCNNCGTETEKFIKFSSNSRVPILNGKSFVNLVFKCKMCSRSCYVSIIDGSQEAYQIEDAAEFKPLVKFDCRGCEPTLFSPEDYFQCTSVSGQEFNQVDLSQFDWADYDEKSKDSVAIYNLKYRFKSIK